MVGFIALFGIATNDGVNNGYLYHQVFEDMKPTSVHDVREAVCNGREKTCSSAMMTTAVAVIALLPVLSSTARSRYNGSYGNPAFGGMVIQV